MAAARARPGLRADPTGSDANASDARVGAVVNPVVDPVSGEPEFKHTPVRIEQFRVHWHAFVLTARP